MSALGQTAASWQDARWTRIALTFNIHPAGDTMEKLIDIFCHAIRITDPLSIKIAVGVIGGGLPLFFLFGLFVMLGELAAGLRESTMPASHKSTPRKERAGRRAVSARK